MLNIGWYLCRLGGNIEWNIAFCYEVGRWFRREIGDIFESTVVSGYYMDEMTGNMCICKGK